MTDKDREAFTDYMKTHLPTPDDEFNAYHLDEGNLRHLWHAALAESAKEIKQLQTDMGGLENLLKLERDKNTRILRESDAGFSKFETEWSGRYRCQAPR
jgi:hypothetical protein